MQRPAPQRGGRGGAERQDLFDMVYHRDSSHRPDGHHHHNPRTRRHPEPCPFIPIAPPQPYGNVMAESRKRPLAYDHDPQEGFAFHPPAGMELQFRYGGGGPSLMMHSPRVSTPLDQTSASVRPPHIGPPPSSAGSPRGGAPCWDTPGARPGAIPPDTHLRGHHGRGREGERGALARSPSVLPPGEGYGAGPPAGPSGAGSLGGGAKKGAEEVAVTSLNGDGEARLEKECNNLSFLTTPDEAEESSHLSALIELAAQNLELKNQLRQVFNQLQALQEVVHKHQEDASQTRYWSVQEHQRFLEAVRIYGKKNLKAIAVYVGTRSATQVKTHSQKYFQKLARQAKAEEGNNSSSGPDGSGGSTNADAPPDFSTSNTSSSYYSNTRGAKSSSNSLASSASPPSS